jgi:hypothetical protein
MIVRKTAALIVGIATLVAISACDKKSTTATQETTQPSASVQPLSDTPRPAMGATETEVSGKIVEKLSHPSYSYLLLDTGKEKVWTAVPSADVGVGAQVTVERAMLMQGYRSTALKRDFEKVYFGTLRGAAGSAAGQKPPHGGAAPTPHGSAAPSPHGGAAPNTPAPAVDATKIKVAKAEGPGGKTVLEVIQGAEKLAGKVTSVRGVVVKANSGIMGKNWLHLQDGSGKAADKSNDLTVTLPLEHKAAVGDTVVVHGKVLTDQNVGAGYHYKVLLAGERIDKAAAK